MYVERHHRRAIGSGHGASAGFAVVGQHLKREDTTTLRVGSRGNTWDLPFREIFEILGYRSHQDGKVLKFTYVVDNDTTS